MRTLLWCLLTVWAGFSQAFELSKDDWEKAQEEALHHLVELIKLDTSLPKGNEIIAASYIDRVLESNQIDYQIFESRPTGASIVARLHGNGSYRPLLLLGHLDVVAVERENWSSDPFSAVLHDGKILGRGAMDDKGIVSGALQVLLLLKRMKVPLNRDVIFLGVADEEGGGELGITFMVDQHLDAINAEFAINEGGRGSIDPETGRYTFFNIGTAEKTPLRARLEVKGAAGHGSVPTKDNPIGVLSRAVAKIFASSLPMRLNETTRIFFRRLAAASQPEEAAIYSAILEPNPSAASQDRLRSINGSYYSMLRTSVTPTIIRGGYQRNVIPSEASAVLDIRALPDTDVEQLFDAIRKIADEPALTIIPMKVDRPRHKPAPLDTLLFKAFEDVLAERHPLAVVLPTMNTGASDSAQLRAAGIPTYGFGPGSGEHSGVHGNDEFLLLTAYYEYLRILWAVVTRVAEVADSDLSETGSDLL